MAWCTAPLTANAAANAAAGSAAAAEPAVSALDARAAVPPIVYRSALTGFVGGPPPAVGNWRSAMDTVTRIGGWREYAKEVPPAEVSTPPSLPIPPAAPGAAGAAPAPRR